MQLARAFLWITALTMAGFGIAFLLFPDEPLTALRRAGNILRIEEKKDSTTSDQPPDPDLLKRPEEKALAKAVDQVEKEAAAAVAREDFAAAMAAMATLRAPVDAFFDFVTVNTQEADLRANRLRLLNRIRATTLTVADFSKIEG